MTDDEAKRREDLIEAELARFDWKISRSEAEERIRSNVATDLREYDHECCPADMAARLAGKIIERETGKC